MNALGGCPMFFFFQNLKLKLILRNNKKTQSSHPMLILLDAGGKTSS
jgi:hypothetical protein